MIIPAGGPGCNAGLWRMARGVKDAERWLDAGLLRWPGVGGRRAGYVALHGPIMRRTSWKPCRSARAAFRRRERWPGAAWGVGAWSCGCCAWFPPGGDAAGLDRLALMLAPLGAAAWVGCWLAGSAYGPPAPQGAWWGLPGRMKAAWCRGACRCSRGGADALVVGLARWNRLRRPIN